MTPALFRPIQIGNLKLGHRVVLSPLTRFRADANHVHTDLGVEYYKQRASVPGTLLITEGTLISGPAGGMGNLPGVYTDDQIAAWKKITDAVHAQGSYIYLQIAALGRAAQPAVLKAENADYPYVAPSSVPIKARPGDVPRELTKQEIKEYIQWFKTAATNAVDGAGFDGVEVHSCHGSLVEQFLQDVTNMRTDEYGGSIENRARFPLEVLEAIVNAIGQTKVAIRLSPWCTNYEMRMEDPVPTYAYLVDQFKQRYPDLAYLHVVSAGAPGNVGPKDESQEDFIYKLWTPRPIITAGGYDRESGIKVAEETGQLVAYGRAFIANPDLPFRLSKNIPLNVPDEKTFYELGVEEGYTTYPFSEEFLKSPRVAVN